MVPQAEHVHTLSCNAKKAQMMGNSRCSSQEVTVDRRDLEHYTAARIYTRVDAMTFGVCTKKTARAPFPNT